jgi:ferredoxin-NADP reductase
VNRFPAPAQLPGSINRKWKHNPGVWVIHHVGEPLMRGYYRHSGPRGSLDKGDVRDTKQVLDVVAREIVATDENVVAFTLAGRRGEPLPTWSPGAHLDVYLPSGRQRQYSLCGNIGDRNSYRIAVRRIPDGGGGSIEMHDQIVVGSTLTVSHPRNAFPLAVPGYGSTAKHIRFVAGGIGITPILPMIALAAELDVSWDLIYTGRTREAIPFLDELAKYRSRVIVRTDDSDGTPTADQLLDGIASGDAVYVCGPAPMIDMTAHRLRHSTDIEFHAELFAPPPVVDGTEFDVQLASTGQRIAVPADRTLLDALRVELPDLAYSCRQGFCGTCYVGIRNGQPDHRDRRLTEDEKAHGMLVCVSRAGGEEPLVLDL